MAVTSGTFNFGTAKTVQLIEDAYQRIGILPDLITYQQIVSAQTSANLILSQWVNRGLNLFTIAQNMLGLNPNQYAYALPPNTIDIMEANVRTSNRQLGGTAFSSAGGIAANAFDGNPATACTQTAPNGYISYDFGTNNTFPIGMVGVQSNATLTYTLNLEYSFDNITWLTAFVPPAQSFLVGQLIWFVVPAPVPAEFFRVRESGGATLNIQELYFNTFIQDIPITRISRSEYVSIPNKSQTGRPTSFWVDRQVAPMVYIWPTPIAPYNNIYYTRTQTIQDIGTFLNTPDIPQRFYEPLVAGLAFFLSMKYNPERMPVLKEYYDEMYSQAAREDSDRAPLRIFGDYQTGWTHI